MEGKAVVYRFEAVSWGRKVSPRHMFGTLDAIAALGGLPLMATAREVDASALEAGFLFEPFNAPEPAVALDTASRRMHVAEDHY